MTDHEFWRTIHRHLVGIVAAIVKRWLGGVKPREPGFIVPADVIAEIGTDKVDRLIEIVRES